MKISCKQAEAKDSRIEVLENGVRIFSEKSEGMAVIKREFLGNEITSEKFFNFDITYESDTSICFAVDFLRKNGGEPISLTVGLLPEIKAQISIPFSALNSQKLFFRATPGKLKSTLHGKAMDISEIDGIALRMKTIVKPSAVLIENICISDTEPEYTVPDKVLVDELGQAVNRDWPGKTKNAEELVAYLQGELKEAEKELTPQPGRSKYGGWLAKQFEATGYFRTQKEDGRWWLVDPLGYAFVSIGFDCVEPDGIGRTASLEKLHKWLPERDGEFKEAWGSWVGPDTFSFSVANLIRAFGKDWFTAWCKLTAWRHNIWGINTIANWSNLDFIKFADMPYVYALTNFPSTKAKIFRDFPDVFSEEYKTNSKDYAKQIEPRAKDKNLIGYFLGNEPHWAFINGLNIAEELLATDFNTATKDEFILFILNKYGDVDSLNQAWNLNLAAIEELRRPIKEACKLSQAAEADLTEFSTKMVDEFIKAPSMALRSVDPNHLNLGIRYAWFSSEALKGGMAYCDVISFNCYDDDPMEELEKFAKATDLPLMIGEYHHGALDAGLFSNGIAAVTTQKERGKAYRYYTERALAFKQCIGAHYFILNDQALLGRGDGENYQIGCVDVCNRPYKEFIDGIKATSDCMYDVACGNQNAFDEFPEVAPRLFY